MKLKSENEKYYLILEYDYVTWKLRIPLRLQVFGQET